VIAGILQSDLTKLDEVRDFSTDLAVEIYNKADVMRESEVERRLIAAQAFLSATKGLR
jgi:hypothetical protein